MRRRHRWQASLLRVGGESQVYVVDADPVGNRLAGDGDAENAIAGKPVSYGSVVNPGFMSLTQIPLENGLPVMAMPKTPSLASQSPTGRW
ncbi:hypothetical protein ACQR3P_02040 [Rhodococcus sp. IEGM1300]